MISILLLTIFFGALVYIGFRGMKKTLTLSDFFLGGRSIGPWFSALAYGTTYFSAALFIGFAGKIGWEFGLRGLWIAAGNALAGSLLAWLVLGRRTRRMTQNLGAMTMPEFLHERYQAKHLKLAAAGIIFVFLLPYSASVFKGLGHLFEMNFKVSYDVALFIMIAITGIYLVLGGYFAIALADFIQGIIMLAGCFVIVAVIVNQAGSFPVLIGEIVKNYPLHIPEEKQPGNLLLAGLVFMTSFGAWGLPHMVQKFYAVRDEAAVPGAAAVATFFAIIIVFTAYFVGAASHAFFAAPPLISGEPDFDRLVPELLIRYLPEPLMAVILLLVLSASMSTLSSLVLVSASAVVIDVYRGHIHPAVRDEDCLAMMRVVSGAFIAFSFVIAKYNFAVIVALMSLSWGAVAGSFMAPYCYSLYWRGVTRAGAGCGMATGFVLAVVLFFVLGPDLAPVSSSIAMLAPFIVVPAVSLFTKRPDRKLLDKAFEGI